MIIEWLGSFIIFLDINAVEYIVVIKTFCNLCYFVFLKLRIGVQVLLKLVYFPHLKTSTTIFPEPT
jgi:heme/copper-type cytochrome/quinol oxidase subunit 4